MSFIQLSCRNHLKMKTTAISSFLYISLYKRYIFYFSTTSHQIWGQDPFTAHLLCSYSHIHSQPSTLSSRPEPHMFCHASAS